MFFYLFVTFDRPHFMIGYWLVIETLEMQQHPRSKP